MSAVYKQYNAMGFEALFAAVNDNPEIANFSAKYRLPFPLGTGNGEQGRAFFEFPMVKPAYVPWLAFIDRAGMIRSQFSGNDLIFKQGAQGIIREIEPLLKEKAAAAPKKAPAPKSTPKK
jgi:hypothetical protein